MPNIDNLNIRINASATSANRAINNLITSLSRLKSAVTPVAGATAVAQNLNEIANAVNKFSGVKLSSTVAKNLDSLKTALNGFSVQVGVASGLTAIARALGSFTGVRMSATIGRELNSLKTALAGFSVPAGAAGELTTLAGALTAFSGLRISSTISRELTALRAVLAGFTIDPTALSQITSLATVISSLNGVKISTNIAKQITEIQRVMSTFTIPPAALTSLTSLATALTTLSTAAAGLRGAAGTIRSTISAASSAAGRSFGGTGTSGLFGGLMKISMLRMVGRWLGNVITLSNQYQEDLNLFTASLGKYASEAKSYAEQVSEAFGLDPAEWMRNLGVFNTLISGYGVAADRAYKMSQNLTQLGYDLSSFFNIKSSDAMSKLQSAIAGELRPMRKLGYDLSQARLEYIAKTLGIEKEISNMNQAEKAQLRYYALLNQVTVAQQDMSRTIDTPANQLRILSAMATQAARAIGNIFIPALNAILPVATAVVKAVRNIANAIANLFGFELTEVDYSGLEDTSGATDDLGDSLDSAGGSAKKLKQALMGFDEINKLPDMNESGGSGGGSEGSDWEWDLSGYDFLGNAVNERLDAVYDKLKPIVEFITDNLDYVLLVIEAIGLAISTGLIKLSSLGSLIAGLATTYIGLKIAIDFSSEYQAKWFETGDVSDLLGDQLTKYLGITIGAGGAKKMGNALGLSLDYTGTIGLLLTVVSTIKYKQAIANIQSQGADFQNVVSAALEGAGIVVGAYTVGGPVLGTIALILTAALTTISFAYDKTYVKNGVRLKAAEIKQIAKSVFENLNVKGKLNLIASPMDNIAQLETDLTTALTILSTDIESFEGSLSTGVTVDINTTAQQLYDDLAGEGGILESLDSLITEKNSYITAYASIGGFVDPSGKPVGMDATAFGSFEGQMENIGKQWGEALQNGIKNGWTEELTSTVAMLQRDFIRMQEAMTYSKTAAEANYTMGQVKEKLSEADVTSLKGVWDEYQGYRNETRTQLEQDYDTNLKYWYEEMTYWENYISAARTDLENETDPAEIEYLTKQLTNAETQLNTVKSEVEKLQDPETRNSSITTQMNNLYGEFDPELYSAIISRVMSSVGFKARAFEYSASDMQGVADAFEASMLNSLGSEFYSDLTSAMSASGLTWSDILGGDYLMDFATNYLDGFNAIDALLRTNGFTMDDDTSAALTALFFGDNSNGDPVLKLVQEALGASLGDDSLVSQVTDIPLEIYDGLMGWLGAVDLTSVLEEMGITVEGMNAVEYYTRTQEEMPTTVSEFVAPVEEAVTAVTEEVTAVEEVVQAITNDLNTAAETAAEELSASTEALDTVVTTYSESSGKISDAGTAVNNAALKIQQAAARLASVTPRVKIEIEYRHSMFNGGADVTPSITVSKNSAVRAYATGGFPKTGSMFIAGERGPELVGRIGNRTAVANDEQISDIISSQMGGNEESLASAIVGAMKAAGMGAVYLDGRQLAASINGETRRTGKSAIVI